MCLLHLLGDSADQQPLKTWFLECGMTASAAILLFFYFCVNIHREIRCLTKCSDKQNDHTILSTFLMKLLFYVLLIYPNRPVFDYTMSWKRIAIIQIRELKVTHALKIRSDQEGGRAKGHACHEKEKRYFRSASQRSPMPWKSKATFQIIKPEVTHLEVCLFNIFRSSGQIRMPLFYKFTSLQVLWVLYVL